MRIVLIHAVTIAIDPIQDAFAERWPEAEVVNILDDSLGKDRAKEADLSSEMADRIQALADYALRLQGKGVLFTCSAFGSAIDRAASTAPIPVLKPNEAMYRQALEIGGRIGMLGSFEPAMAGMEAEFHEMAAEFQRPSDLAIHCIPEAKTALTAGDAETHNRLIAEGVAALRDADVIMLAHFSTARALEDVKKCTNKPVLTSPISAVERLRNKLQTEQ